MDENNEQFVAYFVPTQATLSKRQEDSQLEVSYREEEEYVSTTHLPTQLMYSLLYIVYLQIWVQVDKGVQLECQE